MFTKQIWFQNRRQNTRRKSQPTDFSIHNGTYGSEEGADNSTHCGASGLAVATTDGEMAGLSTDSIMKGQSTVGHSKRLQLKRSSSHDGVKAFQKPNLLSSKSEVSAKSQRPIAKLQRTASGTPMSLSLAGLQSEHAKLPMSLQDLMTSTTSGAGYIANRRNVSHKRQDGNGLDGDNILFHNINDKPNMLSQAHSKPSLVRLSMTSNGRAKVVTETDVSPPKKTPVPIDMDPFSSSELRIYEQARSHLTGDKASLEGNCPSSSSGGSTHTITSVAAHKAMSSVPRLTSGRSRDSRAWEFWCDADARNSLSQKADKERSGSAANAIGLLRSNSKAELRRKASGGSGGAGNMGKRNRAVLAEVSNKRQKSFTGTAGMCDIGGGISEKHSKSLAKERRLYKLKRNASAYGRMQSKDGTEIGGSLDEEGRRVTKMAVKPVVAVKEDFYGEKENRKAGIEEFEVPQTESDKENWDPEVPCSRSSKVREERNIRSGVQPSERGPGDVKAGVGAAEKRDLLANYRPARMRVDRRQSQGLRRKLHNGDSYGRGLEKSNEGEDPEIARFMSGAGGHSNSDASDDDGLRSESSLSDQKIPPNTTSGTVTVDDEEEMHCVESLLSLSRGTWVLGT